MKGGKNEKVMGPLFPRLHVNDTEKGGPRAPPRNKMALYEQLSVPSQKPSSARSTLPLPPHYKIKSTSVPSASSSLGGDHEPNMLSPFYILSSAPGNSSEVVHSRSDAMNCSGGLGFGKTSTKNKNHKTLNSGCLLSTAECTPKHLHDSSNLKNSRKRSSEEDDFRVPTFQHIKEKGMQNRLKNHPGQPTDVWRMTQEKGITTNSCSSNQFSNTGDESMKWTEASGARTMIQVKKLSEQSSKLRIEMKKGTEEAASHLVPQDKVAEASNRSNASSIDKHAGASTNECENTCTGNLCSQSETYADTFPEKTIRAKGDLMESRCLDDYKIVEKESTSRERSESCSRASIGNSPRVCNDINNCIEEGESKACAVNGDKNGDESGTSMLDSVSGFNFSPDDVVGVIGQKHFWKARKAILNQQRVFTMQVFELHRLTKVQKLIAGSPDLLLGNSPCLDPLQKVPSMKPSLEYKPHLQSTLWKDGFQKSIQNAEFPSSKDGSQKQPCIQPLVDGGNKELVIQSSNAEICPAIIPQPTASTDKKCNNWCFPLPGNQWLVPIMSPSEGLVYKPCMGPYPPNFGFMAPIYGGCGPLNLPATAFSVPASHHQPGSGGISGAPMAPHNYFPHTYGFPVINPLISAPPVEQDNSSAGSHPHQQDKHASTKEANINMHSRSSSNILNQNESLCCCAEKLQTSKERDVQRSTASSPCERVQEGGPVMAGGGSAALSLFPVCSAVEDSNNTQKIVSIQNTGVIKVVPHNRSSANVSAARIFQSIQKERQRYDL